LIEKYEKLRALERQSEGSSECTSSSDEEMTPPMAVGFGPQ